MTMSATHYLLGRGLVILLLSSSKCCGNSSNNNKGTNVSFVESRLSEFSPRRHHCQRSNYNNYYADDDVSGNTFRLFNEYGSHHPNRRRRRYIPQHGKYQDRMEMSRKNAISIISPRGGAATAAAAYDEPTKSITSTLGSKTTILNDEDVDQLVDELIASVNDDSNGDNQRQKRSRSTGSVVEPVNEKESNGEEEMVTRNNNDDDERDVDKESALGATQKSNPPSAGNEESPNNHAQHYFAATSLRPNRAFSLPSTPTNAYYRFILRRGPMGHILASFTVMAVQWVYTYVPTLYQLISYLLVKLHIYNPQILYERDRHQSMKRYSTTNSRAGGLKQKFNFFGKSKQEQQQQSMLQKHTDEEAANKLKQLYRTIKIGSGLGMLSEVKYRYLSVAFRRKHGLGKEYRMEKPMTFWGEIVRGSTNVGIRNGDESLEDGLDDELNERDGIDQQHVMISSIGNDNKPSRGQKMQRSDILQPRQGKRKLVADWVVDAFSRHQSLPLTNSGSESTNAVINTRDKVNNHAQISSLWTEVDRNAIIEAARESRAADPSVAKYQGRREGAASLGSDNNRYGTGGAFENDASGTASSGYSASKMFQSVITRVGSNGRVFGAYPNDAFPIEQCANKLGVLGLARKYGYGDWRTSADDGDDSDDNEGCDDLWGGNLD